ncbi:hypothetical protein B0H16DRAFT_1503964 [Mycena metata]|uniref:NAD(P)-binding protein n=1 Tax=Mycena metata TaxID=1033252 RepID=A0AAD7K9S4_9AGAR|nr:hypothetical protein B0H16DRAFT_1503964 [Mycena metata]
MSPLVAFLIGSGRNIGQHTAAALKAKGYQVALGSRKPVVDEVEKEGYFPVTIDAQSVESVRKAFTEVNKKLGPPNVVIFNVSSFTPPPTEGDPLSIPVEAFREHTETTVSLFAAAQEALKGFRSDVNKDALKTFIFTGNPLPWASRDSSFFATGTIQKVIAWRLMEIFASAYSQEKIRFYYASLVGDKGGIVEPLSTFFSSGPQHAQVYSDLITRRDQADWEYRFTLDCKQWTK